MHAMVIKWGKGMNIFETILVNILVFYYSDKKPCSFESSISLQSSKDFLCVSQQITNLNITRIALRVRVCNGVTN